VAHKVGIRPDLLTKTYQNCCEIAHVNGLTSIAFPTISTGLYGYPKEEAAPVAVDAVKQWIKEKKGQQTSLEFIYFVLYDKQDQIAYFNI
jgi:O-acetyl-ADP-ribose deacetylase (regulator of RNase III)